MIDSAILTHLTDPTALPQPCIGSIKSADYKSCAKDFVVNEIMEVDFSGEGEHLWLHIKKSGMNTTYVAKLLSKWAGIALRDVGFSGQKDRLAVTTQWFSLRLPKKQLPKISLSALHQSGSDNESLEVIAQHWHSKKLNRGTHRANQFMITLRQVVGSRTEIDAQLEQMAQIGVPNYFGEQRFGHGGNNLTLALEWFDKGTVQGRKMHPKRDRERLSMLLSASRSAIFNQILAYRVMTNTWNTGLDGEVFNLAGSNSVFASDTIDEALSARIKSADIHPTGVMWGINNDKVQGKAAAIEHEVVASSPVLQVLATGLETKALKASRRPLRLMLENLEWTWQESLEDFEDIENTQVLQLNFTLPTGSFATSVLLALMTCMTTKSAKAS